MLQRFFQLNQHGTTVRTEVVAGITTFMTMAYILFVNNLFLGANGAGIPDQAVFFATALGAGLVTLLMGLFVNIPIALAPGMGLNAYFMSVVVHSNGSISWKTALGAVFISGVVFIILTVLNIRQQLIVAVPKSLQIAITVGIGLFIAIIGFKLANLVTVSINTGAVKDFTQPIHGNFFTLQLGDFTIHPDALLALIGLLIIAVLIVIRVKGALLIGIMLTTLIGIPMKITDVSKLSSATWIPDFSNLVVGQLDIVGAFQLGLFEIIFMFTFVELFDSFGSMIGTAHRMGLMNDEAQGEKKLSKAMLVDAVGVSTGAVLGTSTITVYVESAAGVEEGGRTGLTSVTTGLLFILALFIAPLALIVPSAATAPALIIVGVLMMSHVRHIEWDDFMQSFPAFLTITLMPFTGGIANGISAGILSYVVLAITANLFTDRKVSIHWMMWLLAILVISRYVFIGGAG